MFPNHPVAEECDQRRVTIAYSGNDGLEYQFDDRTDWSVVGRSSPRNYENRVRCELNRPRGVRALSDERSIMYPIRIRTLRQDVLLGDVEAYHVAAAISEHSTR
jgi:hypothetical protein